jgi:membrane associated rhomboid family serine protease
MPFFPLKDYTKIQHIRFQYVTLLLVAACVAVYVWQLSLGKHDYIEAIVGFGIVPRELLGAGVRDLPTAIAWVPEPLTLLTSMFLHGSLAHLVSNMIYLWVFGDNIEDSMGHLRFLAFYLLCGVIGGLAHSFVNADAVAPAIGASGAISGVLGAYLVLHPTARVLVLFGIIPLRLPAMAVLGLWIVLQVLSAAADTGAVQGGVAWWEHIGGFVAGMALIKLFQRGAPQTATPRQAVGEVFGRSDRHREAEAEDDRPAKARRKPAKKQASPWGERREPAEDTAERSARDGPTVRRTKIPDSSFPRR